MTGGGFTPAWAFVELPEGAFPVRVESVAEATGEVVHSAEADGPGAMEIPPGLAEKHGPITVRVLYDGKLMCEIDSRGREICP